MKTFVKQELTLDVCTKMLELANSKAQEIGIKIACTIVDSAANIKVFSRMDGAPLMATDISRKKAVTAVGFGVATGNDWMNFIKEDPILREGVHDIKDYMLLGGGIPILINGELVGAIGVSGAHYTQDETCCHAALSLLK
jgi:uncharacterized protein GlcG (DUF336 family)